MKFLKITDALYRGSRPQNQADMDLLKSSGIKTIISLETNLHKLFFWINGNSDIENTWTPGYWFNYKWSDFTAPTMLECERVAQLVEHWESIKGSFDFQPVFVHCYSGVDRSGFFIAYWKVTRMHLTPEEAWADCVASGMHPWYQWLWKDAFMDICK